MNSELFEIKNLLLNLLQILQQETHIFNYCGLYTQKDLLNLLQISPNTLKSWEEKGLKRLEPPIEAVSYTHLTLPTKA